MLTMRLLIRTLIANWVLTAIVGTALAGALSYGQPLLVIGRDIAGVPVVVYALISTAIPVLILTILAHVIFGLLRREREQVSVRTWHIVGISLGALAGALAGLALQRAHGMVLAGALTGAVCGSLQALTWWRARPTRFGDRTA
jgi:hypothetical protein